jgi:hypothetical protein
MGHEHRAQEFKSPLDGSPILYCGSSFRTTFGELEDKSFLLCVFNEAGRLDHCECIPSPVRDMLLLEAEYLPEGCFYPDFNEELVRGAEIRYRYHVEREHRQPAAQLADEVQAELLRLGAVAVTLEEQLKVHSRARVPEIVEAATIEQKLELYWQTLGDAPQGELQAGILLKAARLEQQVLAQQVEE